MVLFVNSIRNHRRATRGAIRIEIDKLNYIEYDRPRVDRRGTRFDLVHESFLRLSSGREFCDPPQVYRRGHEEGEEFITVAYAFEPGTILCIYRLAEYNRQPYGC